MSSIKIDYTCENRFSYYCTDMIEVVDCKPETLFEEVYNHSTFVVDKCAEVNFTVYDFIDRGDDVRIPYVCMVGTLTITPIRDIGQAMYSYNRRTVEYVYLYDESTLFERPVYIKDNNLKLNLSSLYGISCY